MQQLGFDTKIAYVNLKNNVEHECKNVKQIFLKVIPWTVVAVIFQGFAELALISPSTEVAAIASKCMYGGLALSGIKAVTNLIKIADPNAFGKPKISVVKQEFDSMKHEMESMKAEILFLRQQLQQQKS